MGGPSLLDGLPPLSVTKALLYFLDLTECPKSHPLAKGICLLSPSHALSFKGLSGRGKGNFKFSFFQTSPKAKQATQGWRSRFGTNKLSGCCLDGFCLFQVERGDCGHGGHGEHEGISLLVWLCLPKSALHGSNLHHNPSAQISATEMHLLNAVDKPSRFLIPLPTIQWPTHFFPCFPKASSICLWGLPCLKVTCWAGLLQWHHVPGRWLSHARSQRCPDATEPHEPII